MNEFRDFEELRAKTPEGKARVAAARHALEDALGLAELREKKGMTQTDVATALAVSQANVSKLEHQEDVYFSTMRRYIEALGGQMRVTAVFEDEEVPLVMVATKRRSDRSHGAHE